MGLGPPNSKPRLISSKESKPVKLTANDCLECPRNDRAEIPFLRFALEFELRRERGRGAFLALASSSAEGGGLANRRACNGGGMISERECFFSTPTGGGFGKPPNLNDVFSSPFDGLNEPGETGTNGSSSSVLLLVDLDSASLYLSNVADCVVASFPFSPFPPSFVKAKGNRDTGG